MANLARRGRESVVQVVAFGLGLMVLLLLGVVRDDLLKDWRASLPADTPNFFMINIPAAETASSCSSWSSEASGTPKLFPMIRARMTTINGKPIDELGLTADRAQEFAEREQNLSWARDAAPDDQIVAGRWWNEADRGKAYLSVATGVPGRSRARARRQARLRRRRRDHRGRGALVPRGGVGHIPATFFLVFSPGTLDGLVGTGLTSMELDTEQRTTLADLGRRFPSVSAFDIDAILAQVRDVFNRASLAGQYVFLFTLRGRPYRPARRHPVDT